MVRVTSKHLEYFLSATASADLVGGHGGDKNSADD